VGADRVAGGPVLAGAGASVTVSARRVTGTGTSTLDIDWVHFVPADRSTQFLEVAVSGGGVLNVLDAEQDAVYGIVSAATPFDASAALWNPFMTREGGSLPKLPAGEVSTIYWVRMKPGTAVGATTTLNLSYFPKYLHLAT